jgi:hypothetical protein
MIRHLRLLAWLRWKYLWRSRRWITAILTVVVSIGFAFFLFIGSATVLSAGFMKFGTPAMWEVLHLAFAVLYFLWLYSGSLNDIYDPGRLAPYPIPPRTIFLGSTLSSFIGPMPIIGGALLAGFATGIPGTPVEQIARAAIFLFLIVHLQLVSRLIRLTFLAVLTSRRWRDAAVLLSTLFAGGIYVALQLLRRDTAEDAVRTVVDFARAGGPSTWLAWIPPVWLSWGYALDGVRSAVGLGAFSALTWLVYRAGGWAEERLAFSEPIFHYRRRRASTKGRVRFIRGVARAIAALAGSVSAAVARKEMAVFFRDPAVRHRVLTSVFYVLFPIAAPFFLRNRGGESSALTAANVGHFAGIFLIFIEMFFLTNLFGLEGVAVRTLLAYPAPRRLLFLGKNLAYLAIFGPFNALAISVPAILMNETARLASVLLLHFAALIVVTALGNVNSVYFPLPFLSPGQRIPRRDESGCLAGLARSGLYFLTLFLLAPVFGASFLLELGKSPWALAAAFAGLLYASAIYAIGLKVAEKALTVREEALGDYFRTA